MNSDIFAQGTGQLTIASSQIVNSNDGALELTLADLYLDGGINTGTGTVTIIASKPGFNFGLGSSSADITLSNSELQRITAGGMTIGSETSQNIEINGVTATAVTNLDGIMTLVATNQNAYVQVLGTASTFQAIAVQADDGIDIEQDLTTLSGVLLLNGDADEADDGTSRDHVLFSSGITLTSAQDIDLYARSGGITLSGPLTLNAKRYINIHDPFTGPFGEHEVNINGDSDADYVGGVSVASRVCSIYGDSGSCLASRLCGWCGYVPNTVGHGVVSTSGGTGTVLEGQLSQFTSDLSVGSMIMVGDQARVITSLTNDTYAMIDTKFTADQVGVISVYDGSLDTIIGSVTPKFDQEVEAGYEITTNGLTFTVSAVSSYKNMTSTTEFAAPVDNALFTVGNVAGTGTISTSSYDYTVYGSWPPLPTKFKTQLSPGHIITVNNETRVVDSVIDNNHFTVTQKFDNSFDDLEYTISNIPGTGSISYSEGSSIVMGTDLTATDFTSSLHVGDIITVNGQTRMIQNITDDSHAAVSSVFTAQFDQLSFASGNMHNAPFTTATLGTGTVTTNGTAVFGLGTVFGTELEVGLTFTVQFSNAGVNQYETRTIAAMSRDDSLEVTQAFTMVASGASFYFQTCPSQTAGLTDGDVGTFNLHSKSSRPSTCYNNGRCVPQASHSETFEVFGSGYVYALAGSTTISGINTDFLSEIKPGYTLAVFGAINDANGNAIQRQESQVVTSIVSLTELTVASGFSFSVYQEQNQQFKIRTITGKGAVSSPGGTSTDVTGYGTEFLRDLSVGWMLMVGDEKRVVMYISSETSLTINAPWNSAGGGVVTSAWAFESCISGSGYENTFTLEFSTLEPGCCGTKVMGSVAANNYAYYKITPTHSNYDLRVVASSTSNLVDLVLRHGYAPDDQTFDFKALGEASPWQIELPKSMLTCNNTYCDSLYIGVKGLPGSSADIPFDISAFLEFNYNSFVCEDASADASTGCSAVSISQVGDAQVLSDSTDANNAMTIRLTSTETNSTGAVWYHEKVHLQNGFETTFDFRLSNSVDDSEDTNSEECAAGDGFAFVIQSNSATDIGCSGAALGFASDESQGCDSGIVNSFAIEFDTWHNPSLKDINLRGVGISQVNATASARFSYVHTAFFSEDGPNTADHTYQLAGTPAIPTIADGELHTARVVYIPGSSSTIPGRIFLYIDDLQSFVLTAPLRLTNAGSCGVGVSDKCILDSFGNAYLGFTAASGEVGQNHDIRQWRFCDEPNCGR
jgi:hypothetical protein